MLETKLMANQSSFTLQPKQSKISTGLSKSFNSTRILGSQTNETNQDHKRRCFENMVVRRERLLTQQNVQDVKCAVEAEVVDDTALIETTDVGYGITGFKNRYRKETDVGYGKHLVNDGKKRRNKGFKKPQERCSMKCVKEKKVDIQGVEDEKTNGKRFPEGRGQKGCRKMHAKVKYVYQRKDVKKPKVENMSALGKLFGETVQESELNSTVSVVETEAAIEKDDGLKLDPVISVHVKNNEAEDGEKIFGEAVQETDLNSKVSVVETEAAVKKDDGLKLDPMFAVRINNDEAEDREKILGEAAQETEVNLKVSVGIDKESTTKFVEETETVIEKDDGLKLVPIIAVHNKNNEAEDKTVCENTTVGSKKIAYSREELEALRSMDEEGQKSNWVKVYSGFAPTVAREYAGLVAYANNRPTQRYTRAVNCGYTRPANAILSVPPVLPLCSPSNCI